MSTDYIIVFVRLAFSIDRQLMKTKQQKKNVSVFNFVLGRYA